MIFAVMPCSLRKVNSLTWVPSGIVPDSCSWIRVIGFHESAAASDDHPASSTAQTPAFRSASPNRSNLPYCAVNSICRLWSADHSFNDNQTNFQSKVGLATSARCIRPRGHLPCDGSGLRQPVGFSEVHSVIVQ